MEVNIAENNQKWQSLFVDCLNHETLICDVHWEGIGKLEISDQWLPSLPAINTKLSELTGWEGIFTEGLIEYELFYQAMSNKKFPVGKFLRDDPAFTPYPDYFHDAFGHIPMLHNQVFADYCQEIGRLALKYPKNTYVAKLINRFSWFTVEVGVIRQQNNKAYGGAIISSTKELQHMDSNPNIVKDFKLKDVLKSRIDDKKLQEVFYAVDSFDHLLAEFEAFSRYIASLDEAKQESDPMSVA
jgi:phenylalanine-4-hydroxylase